MSEIPEAQIYDFGTTGSVAGYTCHRCGGWVVNGALHLCPMAAGQTSPVQYNPIITAPTAILDDETKRILRRIADALEKLAAK